MSSIYIYNDLGVSKESLKQILEILKSFLKKYKLKILSAEDIKSSKWISDASLLVMPGGADLPYTRKLNGLGNTIISRYISAGGKYLGICAGAYYGCSSIEFGVGTKLEIIGDRELKFFDGKAIGPVFGKYSYKDNSGATPAEVVIDHIGELPIFLNGGCYLSDGDCKVIATYSKLNLPAIISVKNNNVILSGVHFEYNPTTMDCDDQYLSKVIRKLLPFENKRRQLVQYIFELLNL